ncbi:MAG: hypothetical protein H0W13_10290 [Nitrospirales bacterium]|nr:hypothetical protein [Nitrospirales bacterium]
MALVHTAAIISAFMALLVSCVPTPHRDVILHEGPQGGVYLERISDRNIQATHPIKLDRSLVARILNGVQAGEPRTAVKTLFASDAKPERVFSDEDTAFLAPLITSALSQATADQQVRFQVIHLVSSIAHPSGGGAGVGSSAALSAGPQKKTTAGTLYAHGLSLHFTLSEYRHRDMKANTIGGPNRYYPDPTGLQDREVQFAPHSASRPDSYKQSDGATLVIDYERLAKQSQAELATSVTAPAATAMSAPASASQEPRAETEDRRIIMLPVLLRLSQVSRTGRLLETPMRCSHSKTW